MRTIIPFIICTLLSACISCTPGKSSYFYLKEINKYLVVQKNTVFLADYLENLPENINRYSWCGSYYEWRSRTPPATISISPSAPNIIFLRDHHRVIKYSCNQDFVVEVPSLLSSCVQDPNRVDIILPVEVKHGAVHYLYKGEHCMAAMIPAPNSNEYKHPRIRIYEEIPDCLFHMGGRQDTLSVTSVKDIKTDEWIVYFGDDHIVCRPITMRDLLSPTIYYLPLYVNKDHPNIVFTEGKHFDSYCDSTFIVVVPLNKVFADIRHSSGLNDHWIRYTP